MSGCAALPTESHTWGWVGGYRHRGPQPHGCARMYRTETDKFPKKVQDCPFTDRLAMLAFCLTVLGADVLAATGDGPAVARRRR